MNDAAGGSLGHQWAQSPLLPFLAGRDRRARFSVRPGAPTALAPVDGLLAGAAEVDLTPPPGMPKAGYSSNAHDGNGFRTRLRARVLHLRNDDASLALVQCDLLGGSSVLQHLVAQAIAERTDVPLAGLFIGATHTHAGPGQFLGTDFYNRFASNRSGFDPAFTQFLVDQITGGVLDAVASRRPARVAVGRAEVWGLTRNRSLVPYVQNHTVIDERTEPQRKYVSVNPLLHVIRVDAQRDEVFEPLAATVVFSVHGTGISMKAREYNADLWAYLVGELGNRLEQTHGKRPVVGAIEGTHADVAPAIRPGQAGHLEASRVGRAIGAEAAELFERLADDLRGDIDLATGFREVDLGHSSEIGGVELPRRPAVGAALVAGAHENLTPVVHRIPPFRAGSPKPFAKRNPHGGKWVIGSRWLQPVIVPLRSFPRVLPVQVFRIGDAALVGLPFEVTVESGRRIEEAVLEAVAGTGVERAVLSSVANEYSGYVATAEEYSQQYYEGGHTLYGPDTQRFLALHAARLAAETVGVHVVSDPLRERSWDLRIHRYLPSSDPDMATRRRALTEPTFTDPSKSIDGYWEFEWLDVAPGDLAWHQPLVRIEGCDTGEEAWEPARRGGRAIDDSLWDLEISHLGSVHVHDHEEGPEDHGIDGVAGDGTAGEDSHDGPGGDGATPHDHGAPNAHRYRVRWFDPVFRAGRRHRFVVVANNGRPEITSDPFD